MPRTNAFGFLLASSVMLATPAALAQNYVQSQRAQTFTPLSAMPGIVRTPITLVATDQWLPADDEGFAANIPIGFTFEYLGQPTANVGLSSNGWVSMTAGALPPFAGNTALGSSSSPNNMIALWWDDLASTSGSYATFTLPSGQQVFVLEVLDFSYWSCPANGGGRIQLWLFQGSNAFEVHYDGTNSCGSFSATAGWEGPAGTPSGAFETCSPFCRNTNFNASFSGQAFRVQPVVNDVAVTSVRLEDGPCAGTNRVHATLANLGVTAVTNFPVQYVQGSTPVVETFSGTIPPGGVASFAFATSVMVTPGTATFTVSASLPADDQPANDTRTVDIEVRDAQVVSTFPYVEDFEGGAGGDWISGGVGDSWTLGTPAKLGLSGAASGVDAWFNGVGGTYNDGEASWVVGPCFDFTNVPAPTIELSLARESNFASDAAVLETSLDGGATWTRVGAAGDNPTWYDRANGWSGSEVDYVRVRHTLGNGTGGSAGVLVRVAFTADVGGVNEGIAFDDVRVANEPGRFVVHDDPIDRYSAVAAGTSDVLMQRLDFESAASDQTLSSITATLRGTLADTDIARATIYLDDGDGVFEPGQDVLGAMGTFSMRRVTLNAVVPLFLGAGQIATVWIAVDLDPAATPGGTFGVSVEAINDIAAMPGPVALFPSAPLQGELSTVFEVTSGLPFEDDFATTVANRQLARSPGNFLAASGVGQQVGTVPIAMPATVRTANRISRFRSARGSLIAAEGGQGVVAFDYHFDLTAYDPTLDDVWFEVNWSSPRPPVGDVSNIFVSADGGTQWIAAYRFSDSMPPAADVDLSALFRANGLTFADDVTVRVQLQPNGSLPFSGMLLDTVWTGIPQKLRVEQRTGVPIAIDGGDDVGTVFGLVEHVRTYTIHNDGHRSLVIDEQSIEALLRDGADFLGGSVATATIAPGASTTMDIRYRPNVDGAFALNLAFSTNDPRLNGPFTFALAGVSEIRPEIEVSRSGVAIASGGTDTIGGVTAGVPFVRSYVVHNLGSATLNVSAATVVANGANALVTSPVPSAIPGSGTSTVTLTVTPDGGPFDYTLTLESDDADEGTYTILATGDASEPTIRVTRMGADVPPEGVDAIGTIAVDGPTVFTYAIANSGPGQLVLTGAEPVTVDTTSNAMVTVTQPTAGTIGAGAQATFTVELRPAAAVPVSAGIAIASNADANPFRFTIDGTAAAEAPNLEVARDGTTLANGATEDVSDVTVGVAQSLMYTIENTGNGPLTITGATFEGATNATGSITSAPASSLAPGAETTFAVGFQASAVAEFSFSIAVASDDPDTARYVVTVRGRGVSGGGGGGDDGGDEGCGCATTSSRRSASWAAWLAVACVALARRRRR